MLYSLPEEDNRPPATIQLKPNNYNLRENFNGGSDYNNVVDTSNNLPTYNINNNNLSYNINEVDDTEDDPWPESFDPLNPEKPFLPISKNNRYQNSIIEHEAHSNLISYRRPQRNQKQFDVYNYPIKKDVASSKSFKPSIKGPKEFFPSIKGDFRNIKFYCCFDFGN